MFDQFLSEQSAALPGKWASSKIASRLANKDTTLWPGYPADDILSRMGWMDLPKQFAQRLETVEQILAPWQKKSPKRVFLLGMGGSSLAPEVFSQLGRPQRQLHIIDSTHPDFLRAQLDLLDSESCVIVSSKSGGTVETRAFFDLFWHAMQLKTDKPAENFCIVTDPDSQLEHLATERGINQVIHAPPAVGGRFSALSEFGLVPALLCGLQPQRWHAAIASTAAACSEDNESNPAFQIAAHLVTALRGDLLLPLTLSSQSAPLTSWIEQLVAESLGKNGLGVLPVLKTSPNGPVIGIDEVAATMLSWECATAIAAAEMKIQPFDQPNVESTKQLTRQILSDGDNRDSSLGEKLTLANRDLETWLANHRSDHTICVCLLGFIDPCCSEIARMTVLAERIKAITNLSVLTGIGPRYLHASGQLYKASPQRILFVQCLQQSVQSPLAIPGQTLTFGRLFGAQADADLLALKQAGARCVRLTNW